MSTKENTFLSAFLTIFTAVSLSIALDTTEPFDIGFTDNEMYVGFGGAGLGKGEKALAWEHVIGAGITDKLATTFFYSLEANEFLGNQSVSGGIGVYLSVLDLDLFDIDILSSFDSEGSFGLATELNIDFSKAGIQLTVEEGMENAGTRTHKILFNTNVAPLIHFSPTESIQLLTGIDFAIIHSGVDSGTAEVGGAGLGLNVGLNDAIELITEVNFDIPQDEEKFSTGMSIGFVATLPWAK